MAIAPDNYIVLSAGKFDLANGAGAAGIGREFTSLKAAPFPSVGREGEPIANWNTIKHLTRSPMETTG
jgi:hypothetical protein